MMEVDGLDGDLRKFIGIAQPQARPAGDPVFGWLVGGMVGWLVGSGKRLPPVAGTGYVITECVVCYGH